MSIYLGTGNSQMSTGSRDLLRSTSLDLGISNLSVSGYSGEALFKISGKDNNNNPSLFTGISFKSGKVFSEQSKFIGAYQEDEVISIRLQMKNQEGSTGSFYEFSISGSQQDSDLKFNGYSSIEKYEQFLFTTSGSGFSVKFDPIFKGENINLNVTASSFEPSGNLTISIENTGDQNISIETSQIFTTDLNFSAQENQTGVVSGGSIRTFTSKDSSFYPSGSTSGSFFYQSFVQQYLATG
jgi:hypothetical protein